MKSLICLIMSIHLLILSAWPCADGCLMLRVDQPDTASLSSDDHQHDDNAGPDLCSPFCGCACCGTVLEPGQAFQFAFVTISFTSPRHEAFVPSLSSPFISYWQPPQIG